MISDASSSFLGSNHTNGSSNGSGTGRNSNSSSQSGNVSGVVNSYNSNNFDNFNNGSSSSLIGRHEDSRNISNSDNGRRSSSSSSSNSNSGSVYRSPNFRSSSGINDQMRELIFYQTHFKEIEAMRTRLAASVAEAGAATEANEEDARMSASSRRLQPFSLPHSSLPPSSSSESQKKKRTRAAFTQSQIAELEQMFQCKKYLSGNERSVFARELNLTETQIKIWFQNR